MFFTAILPAAAWFSYKHATLKSCTYSLLCFHMQQNENCLRVEDGTCDIQAHAFGIQHLPKHCLLHPLYLLLFHVLKCNGQILLDQPQELSDNHVMDMTVFLLLPTDIYKLHFNLSLNLRNPVPKCYQVQVGEGILLSKLPSLKCSIKF